MFEVLGIATLLVVAALISWLDIPLLLVAIVLLLLAFQIR